MSNLLEGIDFSALKEVEQNQEAAKTQAIPAGEVEIPIDDIIPDPKQPRRTFNEDSLDEMAATIKKRGLVQPVILRPRNDDGKHVLVAGERRWRASKKAGKQTVRAVIRVQATDGYDQMIENIQREDLAHTDVAHFIKGELDKGEKPSAIAAGLGKPKSWVSLYTGFFDMHESIRDRVEDFGIRAAYELHKAMSADEDATLAFLASNEAITQRDAIAFAKEVKAPAKSRGGEVAGQAIASVTDITANGGGEGSSRSLEAEPSTPARAEPAKVKAGANLAVMVQVKGRAGRLILDRQAEQGAKYGVISFDNGAAVEEVELTKVKLIEMKTLE